MSRLTPVSKLASADLTSLEEQARLRRGLLERLLVLVRSASSPDALLTAFAAHASSLDERGLNDDAARLNALAKAVHADLARLSLEAVELEKRLVSVTAPGAHPVVAITASK